MGTPSQNIQRTVLEKISGVAGGASPTGKGNITVNAHTILKNLDSQFVSGYVQKLEEATSYLNNYIYELDALDKRMTKAKLSKQVRASLGGRAIDKKRAAVNKTMRKLRAHQAASVERLLPS